MPPPALEQLYPEPINNLGVLKKTPPDGPGYDLQVCKLPTRDGCRAVDAVRAVHLFNARRQLSFSQARCAASCGAYHYGMRARRKQHSASRISLDYSRCETPIAAYDERARTSG